MKTSLRLAVAAALLCPLVGLAQQVDLTKYPDYSTKTNPNPALMIYGRGTGDVAPDAIIPSRSLRPDHVDNGKTKYFPPVFNQHGGSCGSASRIRYMFTEELASYRDVDATLDENSYPTHFVWLLTNGNSGKDAFIQHVGVPSAAAYGGHTYSELFGGQVETDDCFGWMTGYDKWYAAMFNRMEAPYNFPKHLGTEEGREAVKNYLWNHNGDPDFKVGGIVGLGVASAGDWQPIPSTPANDAIGVTGMKFVNHWGKGVDHAVTIVGYDDRIEFDLNGNGIFGEKEADEVGAWIIVNSWGAGWCNGGFVYCPYAYAGPTSQQDANGNWYFPGNWWTPEVYTVRKNYRPLRTIKLTMDYSHRSEIALSAGISTDVNATKPDKTVAFHHFQYAGDGNYGNTVPAPAVPMLGRWADGRLHDEPMEFGYDLTDLTAGVDLSKPLKYFFIVDTKPTAIGSGHIYGASIMDYDEDPDGIELPFDLGPDGQVEIMNEGDQTVITVVAPAQTFFPARNLVILSPSTLSWDAPAPSSHNVEAYEISLNGNLLTRVGASTRSLDIEPYGEGTFAVVAVYDGNRRSAAVKKSTPVALPDRNIIIDFDHAGFTIPDIFDSSYQKATIEFTIRPKSLTNYNQSAGQWGRFMFHANSDGSFTAGWNTSAGNRCFTPAGALSNGRTHVAMVVDGNHLIIYIEGKKQAEIFAPSYSGIGGFGDLSFANGSNGLHATMDELRIWDVARTADEIAATTRAEFSGSMLPDGLIAYYKADTLTIDGKPYLRDCVGGYHAPINSSAFTVSSSRTLPFSGPSDPLAVEIVAPADGIFAGIPATLTASASVSASLLEWTIPSAGIENLAVRAPEVTFPSAGEHTVKVVATDAEGNTVESTKSISVAAAPAPDATFTPSATEVGAGQRVSFIANNPRPGYSYEWAIPGAEVETVRTVNAGAAFSSFGKYTVTLTVTAPDGRKASSSADITVTKVAPVADMRISDAVVVKGDAVQLMDASKFDPDSWTWILSSSSAKFYSTDRALSFFAETPGAYDVSLIVSNDAGTSTATRERGLIITNADSENGLTFSGLGGTAPSLALSKSPITEAAQALTIEWWMNPSRLENFCLGIGEDASSLMLSTSGSGAMIFASKDRETYTHDGFVIAGQWHHYAVTFSAGDVAFYRDGIQQYSSHLTGLRSIPAPASFAIGLLNAQMNGSIDEFRIWTTAFADDFSRLLDIANRPLTAEDMTADLLLYYDFNQDGGDVVDRSGHSITGVRQGFGPDGDAWGPSRGVFALASGAQLKSEDVTGQYLKNYTKPFEYDSNNQVNNQKSGRWFAIKDWTLDGSYTTGSITTGVHVDLEKNTCWTATSGWDGFGELADHAAYQTVTLPAGAYSFRTRYDSRYEGDCDRSYLVVAPGVGLPATADLAAEAIAYTPMIVTSLAPGRTNTLNFYLTEPHTVSLGVLVNMNGSRLMAIENFALTRTDMTLLENDPSGIALPEVDAPASRAGIYDLQGRRLSSASAPGIYIIDGRKVIIRK